VTGRGENARVSEATCGFDGAARKPTQAERKKQWLEENREAIAHYNRRVAEHGLLSDDAGLL
jgi:post-segregation antitoxin (ccd killing protein)